MLVAMQLRMLASSQWLFEETGSAAALGLLGVIQLISMPLIIYGGLLADIFDRKKLMIFTQGFSFVVLFSIYDALSIETPSGMLSFFVSIASGISKLF